MALLLNLKPHSFNIIPSHVYNLLSNDRKAPYTTSTSFLLMSCNERHTALIMELPTVEMDPSCRFFHVEEENIRGLDMSPCDYDLFVKMKEPREIHFNSREDIRAVWRSLWDIYRNGYAGGVWRLSVI